MCVLVLVASVLSMLSSVFSEWNMAKVLEMSHRGETCLAGLSKAASPHTLFSFPVHFSPTVESSNTLFTHLAALSFLCPQQRLGGSGH